MRTSRGTHKWAGEPGLSCHGPKTSTSSSPRPAHPRSLCQSTNSALSCTALSWPALAAALGAVRCVFSWYVWVLCGKHIQTHCCIHVQWKALCPQRHEPENKNRTNRQNSTVLYILRELRVPCGQIYVVPACAYLCWPNLPMHGHTKSPTPTAMAVLRLLRGLHLQLEIIVPKAL